jgi:hypothetical protein
MGGGQDLIDWCLVRFQLHTSIIPSVAQSFIVLGVLHKHPLCVHCIAHAFAPHALWRISMYITCILRHMHVHRIRHIVRAIASHHQVHCKHWHVHAPASHATYCTGIGNACTMQHTHRHGIYRVARASALHARCRTSICPARTMMYGHGHCM